MPAALRRWQHLTVSRAALALAGLLLASTAPAAPAPWYLWQSRLTGEKACAKVLAGAWDKVAGPFTDGRCEHLERAPQPTVNRAGQHAAN